jgi:hypothetical protein
MQDKVSPSSDPFDQRLVKNYALRRESGAKHRHHLIGSTRSRVSPEQPKRGVNICIDESFDKVTMHKKPPLSAMTLVGSVLIGSRNSYSLAHDVAIERPGRQAC